MSDRVSEFLDLANEQARATHANGNSLTITIEANRLLATLLTIRYAEAGEVSAGFIRLGTKWPAQS